MKSLLLLLLFYLFPLAAQANPFQTSYVCLPPLVPNRVSLEFEVREGLPCREGEQLMRVSLGENGAVVLTPTEAPLPPEDQKALKEFKDYHGIKR